MAFWSTQKVKQQLQHLKDLIDPYNLKRVQQGAYELCLSDQALTTPLDSSQPNPPVNGVLMIKPGQFGLLYTVEKVRIPADVIAFISIKASIKFKGLVNVSGFHVDPGYHGRLKFSVYNAGTETVPLGVGEPAFLIWFADLDQPTEDPYARPHQHVDQKGITPEDRLRMQKHVPSPTALEQRLGILEYRWRIFVGASKYFILPMVVAVVAGFVLWLLTVILPPRAAHDTLSRIVGHQRASEVAPFEATSPEAARGTEPRLHTPIISGGGTPMPSATINPSAAPRP
jgi:dCTP deaminase